VKQFAIVLLMTAALTACGGGGGEVTFDADTTSNVPDGVSSTGSSTSGESDTDTEESAPVSPAGGNAGSDNNSDNTSQDNSGNTSPINSDNTNSDTNDNANLNNDGPVANGITATHRNGQTFLVWQEVDDQTGYHVYRHDAPITSDNLGSAERLTDRWGPLDQNTSVNRYGSADVPANFVISDSGQPLGNDRGLFVHTTQNNQQGSVYYAVTSVVGGDESRTIVAGANATSRSVNESVSTPRPVLTASTNGGSGRIYTQYMDYALWNPTLNGYAFNFAVALPANYNSSRAYPLMVELHAFGGEHKFESEAEFGWQVIQLFPSDPGDSVNAVHTWWYGHAKDHNYKTQGSVPRSGEIENFTEQRVLSAIDFLINDGQFNVDRDLVHAIGHSMGGTGALALGIRYPSVIAGIYASEPMTNFASSPGFQENFSTILGDRSSNLPVVNNGLNNSEIRKYDSSGSQPTGAWNWMNHQEQLVRRRGDDFAYLMVDHGKADNVIDWQSQGRPMAQVFTDARTGFSASAVGGVGHSWLGFDSVVTQVFGLGFGDESVWRYPRSLSFPGIHNASGSGSLQPASSGDDRHNTTTEWSTPVNNFHQGIVDSSNQYEISLRSTTSNQTADITPRNTSAFKPSSGTVCSWTATSIGNNATIGSGTSTVDGSRLLTMRQVAIQSGSGTRLRVNCP